MAMNRRVRSNCTPIPARTLSQRTTPRPGIGFAVMHAAHRIDAQALTEVMAPRRDCD
ncbi:hypothetical protein P355_0731 [Burkholderia cenocepacia KC-01]|nr:hypothetical protein P355_0731 [Burkholderia cenocepacia KC-01]